jgi:hypothetical protein
MNPLFPEIEGYYLSNSGWIAAVGPQGKDWYCSEHDTWSQLDPVDKWKQCVVENCRVEVFVTSRSSNMYPVRMVYS